MQSFEWIDARSVEQAAALLAAGSAERPVVAKAGGMDLMDLMKEGIVAPARVVNLRTIDALAELRFDARHGLHLGALCTLADIASSPAILTHYRALAEAAAHAATPQVRNAATIGGNLLQRPRCWYFRNQHFHAAGSETGTTARQHVREDQYGAIFDNAATSMVHASTPATALIAYGASVHLRDAQGRTRSVALQDFLLPPDMNRDRDAQIERNEVLTHVTIPALPPQTRVAYHKQTERDSYDWPICDVAVVLGMQGNVVADATIVLGWVAPLPRRASQSEALLVGRTISEQVAAEAARAALLGATPSPRNRYKATVLETVLRRTILAAA
jgi:xanthine dehydrogenase YagS FAD-binding subunit